MQTPSDFYPRERTAASVFSAIPASLDAGVSTAIQFLGDFATNENTEFAEVLARRLADEKVQARVPFYFFNDGTTPTYGQPNYFGEGQTTPGAVFRDRCIKFSGALPRRLPNTLGMITGNLEVSTTLQHDTWRPAAIQTFGGYWNVSNNQRAWKVSLNTDGSISLFISLDGTVVSEFKSSASMPVPTFPLVARQGVKVTRDSSTGTVKFFRGAVSYNAGSSTESTTWTQLGTDITIPVGGSAAVTGALFSAVTASTESNLGTTGYTIGGFGTTGERLSTARMTVFTVRDGIDGPAITPQTMESWQADSGNTDQSVIEGPPVLYIHNAAPGGGSINGHWLNATKQRTALRRQTNGVVVLFTGANEGVAMDDFWYARLDNFLTFMRSWVKGMSLIVVNGYPLAPIANARLAFAQARRAQQTVQWGLRNGVPVIDTFRAFQQYVGTGRTISDLVINSGNGNDLTLAGKSLMADVVWRSFFSRVGG